MHWSCSEPLLVMSVRVLIAHLCAHRPAPLISISLLRGKFSFKAVKVVIFQRIKSHGGSNSPGIKEMHSFENASTDRGNGAV